MAPKSDITAITEAFNQALAPLTQAITALVQLQTAQAQPKAAIPAQAYQYTKTSPFLPKGSHAAPADLAAKDEALRRRFQKRGFSVTLKDRSDPNKPYDVRPFKGWLEQGRIVRKGQKGVLGLFHITQTDPLPSAKPAKAKAKKA
jgi:hypothetical protein